MLALNCLSLRKISTRLNVPLMPILIDVWYEFNQTREIIQNIKQLLLEGSREILCWPVKEPLSVFKMKWNYLASLPIVSLNVRARCVKSVAKLVNWLLFSIVCRKYCLLNWGQIYIVLSLHRILITVQNRGITVAKEVPANLKKSMNELFALWPVPSQQYTRRCLKN